MSLLPPDRSGRRRSNVAKRLAGMLAEIEADGRGTARPAPLSDEAGGRSGDAGPDVFDQETARTSENPAVPDAAALAAAAVAPGPPTGTVGAPAPRSAGGARSRGGGEAVGRSGPDRRHLLAWAAVVVLLMASIPFLGYVGFQRLLDSRGGSVAYRSSDSTEPGFEAIVEATPTALVILTDEDGDPESLTVLTLGAGESGGTVVFVPIDTLLDRPVYYWNRIRLTAETGDLGVVELATARLLRVGFTETIVVDREKWAELVRPVAPIVLDNPDALDVGQEEYPVGEIELAPGEVGPYLLARDGQQESDLNRINRQELFWRAWLEEISASDEENPVPGETDTGLGRFLRVLARGTVKYRVLPVVALEERADDGRQVFLPLVEPIRELMTEAVPFPVAASPGDRFAVRLLNGVRGEFLPAGVTDPIVAAGAQITSIGNASSFDQETTTIEYHDEADKESAEAVREAMGAGELVFDRSADDTVAMTITIGLDVLAESGEGPTTEAPSTSRGTDSSEDTVDDGDDGDDDAGGNGD